MKAFYILGFLFFAGGMYWYIYLLIQEANKNHLVSGLPTTRDEDEHIPRWALIPNDDGKMLLSDLKPVQEEIAPLFNVETDIIILLYTRNNPTAGQRLFNTAASINNSNFNPAWPVRFLIHGWLGSQTSDSIVGPRNAYIAQGNFNVIAIDWEQGAQTINYITARNRVSDVGAFVGE